MIASMRGKRMLLTQLAAFLKEHGGGRPIHIVRHRDQYEEESAPPQAEPTYRRAEVVEGDGTIRALPVQKGISSRFTYFIDGIQRTYVPLFWAHVPVLYGYAAAVVRERKEDRRMYTWSQPKSQEALYFPFELIDPSEMRRYGISQLCDISRDLDKARQEVPLHILDCARKRLQKTREDLEIELAKRWADGPGKDCGPRSARDAAGREQDGWLLLDGSLTGARAVATSRRIVGLIKSHQTQYFPLEDQRKILGLQPGERSSVFRTLGAQQQTPVYTWYLRLHSNAGRDVYFGLVRIEAAESEETLHLADEISGWLMAERAPLSLPDSRWDRLLYPIRDCEQYCRSLAPSQTWIEAALAGL